MSKQQAPIPLYFDIPFFQTPNDIFEVAFLNEHAKLTYVYLCRVWNNRNPVFPSYETIGAKCGFSRRTAIRAINDLEESGLIVIKHQPTGTHDPNEYTICTEYFVSPKKQRTPAQEKIITRRYVNKHPDTARDALTVGFGDKILLENGKNGELFANG